MAGSPHRPCRSCIGRRRDNKVLVVRSPPDLLPLLRPFAGFDDILLPEDATPTLADRREDILRLHLECGCAAGEAAMVAGAVAAAAYLAIRWARDEPTFAASTAAELAAAILLLTLAAKFATVLVARYRLRKLVKSAIASHAQGPA